jgi:hypothetical protein
MTADDKWVHIAPTVWKDLKARRVLRDCVRRLLCSNDRGVEENLSQIRQQITLTAKELSEATRLQTALSASVLCDLHAQGWCVKLSSKGIELASPLDEGNSLEERKAQVRAAHLIERDAQLCKPSVRRFIRDMEGRRLHNGEWHSVFSLMRDGQELARGLLEIRTLPAGAERITALRQIVDPYVQVVRSDAVCAFTGLRLSDVWRYFRHTWNTAYQSTPGRKVWVLIRDRAGPNHPIVGIGALGSAIVQLSARDRWIGWTAAEFLARLGSRPTLAWARWLQSSLSKLISQIHVGDFRAERLLRRGDIARPTEKVIRALRALAAEEWQTHRLYPSRREHKTAVQRGRTTDWKAQSGAHLFRAKRAEYLAELLEARRALQDVGFRQPSVVALRHAIGSSRGARAIAVVLRYVKGTHIGVDMMDITICGAVAPYNALLGGKLVSLLMASPEIAAAYNERYRDAPRIIASSMAGRRASRRPTVVLLGTTSLYGIASSQYNRLRMPAERAGGRKGDELAFLRLGKTVGFGSFHFSRDTMGLLEILLARQQHGRPVNSIFGEGVNPKLRKVRSGLDLLGFPSDVLLQHGRPRIIYAIPLARNFREVLLGRARRATALVPNRPNVSARIAEFWVERWLMKRLENNEVLAAVEAQRVVYPMRHGARVTLPSVKEEEGPLFADIMRSSTTETNEAVEAQRLFVDYDSNAEAALPV